MPSATLDNAVSREAAWLGVDPPSGWTVNPPPNLLRATLPNPGPLDDVQGYLRSPDERWRALYIVRTRVTTDFIEEGTGMQWRHEMTALLHWDFEVGSGQLEDEMQALDTAVAAIEWRIRGPVGDKSHGGQFGAVGWGDSRDVLDIRFGNGSPTAARDAYQAGEALTVTFSYVLYDWFVG